MRRLAAVGGLVAASASTCSHSAAADKTSLACIQASDEGQTARDGGNLLRARELFAQCTEPRCPALIRRDCASWLEKLELQIPSIVLGARDAEGRDRFDASVTIDGQPLDRARGGPIELNPGAHLIRWESAGEEPVEIRISLRPQEKNRPVIATLARSVSPATVSASFSSVPQLAASSDAPKPSDPASTRGGLPVASYVIGGVGLAALGAFSYFGLRAKRDSDAMHDGCAPACAHDDVAALKTKLVVADVALGVGALSLGAAAFLALRGSSPAPKTLWDFRIAPVVGGARAGVEFRY